MEKTTGKHKFLPGTEHKTAADTGPGSAWEARPFVFLAATMVLLQGAPAIRVHGPGAEVR